MQPVPEFDAALVAARPLTPYVRELTFERVDGEIVTFDAGQWVNIVIPSDQTDLKRSYSIASAPNDSSRFALAVTHVNGGPGSTFLHQLQEGEKVRVQGPQGLFTRRHLKFPGPTLFVATGTGLTPLRSMLLDELHKRETRPLWVLLGARTEADLLYRDELESLAGQHRNVQFIPTLSQANSAWHGHRGYVQVHVSKLWTELSQDARPHAFICGLQRMVSAVRDLLRKEMNVPREQVHSERYD